MIVPEVPSEISVIFTRELRNMTEYRLPELYSGAGRCELMLPGCTPMIAS